MDVLFSVTGQRLRCHSTAVYVEGSREYLFAQFTINDEWKGKTITATFSHTDVEEPVSVILDDTLCCAFPAKLLISGELSVWLRGDDEQVITTNKTALTIYSTGTMPEIEDVEDQYHQMIDVMRNTQELANAAVYHADGAAESAGMAELAAEAALKHANDTAKLIDDANAIFELLSGIDAEVETLSPGSAATIRIVDDEGGRRIVYGIPVGDVGPVGPIGPIGPAGPVGPRGLQGERGERGLQGDRGERGLQGERGMQGIRGPQGLTGPKGDTPIRGVDYWTEADKQAIIAEVLALLNV